MFFGRRIIGGVLGEPVAPSLAVRLVGFFVNGEIGGVFRAGNSIETVEAINFGGGDFGYLGLVGVKGGDGFGEGAVGADVAEGVHDVLRARKGRGGGDVFFSDAQCGAEIAPELRMRAGGVFFFGEVLNDDRLERFIGAGREDAKMLGEGFDVAVILSGVELEGCAGEFAGLPVLIEGMVEEILLRDGGVDFVEKLCGRHEKASV